MKQVGFRLPDTTRQQLDQLRRVTGQTLTQVLIVAIDRYYRDHIKGD